MLTQFEIDKIRKAEGLPSLNQNGGVTVSLADRLGVNTPAPTPVAPEAPKDLIGRLGQDYANAIPNFMAEAGRKDSSTSNNPVIKTIENAGSATVSGLSTVFAPIGELIKSIHDTFNNNPNSVGNFTKDQIDSLPVVQDLKSLAQQHPEATRNLSTVTNLLLAVLGEKTGATDTALPKVGEIKTGTKEAVSAIKDATATQSSSDLAGTIAQGKTADIPAVQRTLSSLDTTGVKNTADLSKKIVEQIKPLAEQVDSALNKDTTVHKLKDLSLPETSASGATVKTNYVKEAINNLKELYTKTGDNVSAVNMRDLLKKANQKGLTYKEVNDLSRQYNSEFGSKAFSKVSGDPLTSVNAQKYENVRTGLKSTARQGMGGAEAKALDAKLSDLYDTQKLIDAQVERVNSQKQKTQPQGIIQKAVKGAVKTADLLTGSPLKAIGKEIGLGGGNSIDHLTLDKSIPKNLKLFREATAREASLAKGESAPATPAELKTSDGIFQHVKQNDGITVNSNGDMPDTGYVVSPSKATETKIPADSFSPESIIEFKKKWAKELAKPDAHFGVWKDGENYVLDVSTVVTDLNKALDIAKKGKQDAIFNLDTFKSIFTKDVLTPPKGRGNGVLNRELKNRTK